ncbi:hypothetical protein GGI20_002394 [Coemansia sp. BCRC 34301]|nr:hypothetical protein GGI20_002394 [Coemansia sp. BCRC 34301]
MLMSIDPRPIAHQTEYLVDYLKLDPFASQATYFEPFMKIVLARLSFLDKNTLMVVLDIVVNRVELGDASDAFAWKCLALMIKHLYLLNWKIIDEVFSRRLAWWVHTYFSAEYFLLAGESDLTVYKAVCAQQLLNLEFGHPVYALLSGKLTKAHETFVNTNIRV